MWSFKNIISIDLSNRMFNHDFSVISEQLWVMLPNCNSLIVLGLSPKVILYNLYINVLTYDYVISCKQFIN